MNRVKAGAAVPVKFALGGNRGLDVFDASNPGPKVVPCGTLANVDAIEQTVTAGASSLSLRPRHPSVHLHLENRQGLGGYLPPVGRRVE